MMRKTRFQAQPEGFMPAARAALERTDHNPASKIPSVLLGICKSEDTRLARTGGRIVAIQAALIVAFSVYQSLPGF